MAASVAILGLACNCLQVSALRSPPLLLNKLLPNSASPLALACVLAENSSPVLA